MLIYTTHLIRLNKVVVKAFLEQSIEKFKAFKRLEFIKLKTIIFLIWRALNSMFVVMLSFNMGRSKPEL